jgi:hypothetical protein
MITIQKNTERSDEKVRVTFTMPAMDGCGCLYLVGWFDEWRESIYRMQRADDGTWRLTLELEPSCDYFYCFRTDDGRWLNDPDVSRAPHPYGSKNLFIISREALV